MDDYIHGTAPSEQERLARLNRLTNPAFLEYLELPPEGRVLEVGSGLGLLTSEMAKRLPRGEVWGLEREEAQLARVPAASNLHWVKGDAHRLPFEDGFFDSACCRYLLEHVADPALVLKEMCRVLKPGGRVFLQENNILIHACDPDCPRFDAVWRKFAELQERLGGDATIGKKLFGLLQRAGFEDIELSLQPEVHSSGLESFRLWVENLIGNLESGREALLQHGLAAPKEIQGAIDELRALLRRGDAATLFYWNRARARKINHQQPGLAEE